MNATATHRSLTTVWAIMLVVLLAACSTFGAAKIEDILDNPRDYDGKTVTIRGAVTGSLNVLVVKTYTVRDDTGEITVVTERSVPRTGDRITVKGRVNQAFAIADKSLVVIVEEAPQ